MNARVLLIRVVVPDVVTDVRVARLLYEVCLPGTGVVMAEGPPYVEGEVVLTCEAVPSC